MAITISTATTHGPRVTYNEYVPTTPHKICSVFPREIHFDNHNGSFTLPACEDGQDYSFVEVGPGCEKYDLGEDRHIVSRCIKAKDIAEDYIGIPSGRSDYTDRGIFVPEGDRPTGTEIAEARQRLRRWFESQISEADHALNVHGNVNQIETNARLALKYLGLTRPWGTSYTPEETQTCPACIGQMRKGAFIHSTNDRGGCGQKIAYRTDGEAFWPDSPNQRKPEQPQKAAL